MKEMKKWKIVALCTVLACLSIVASGTLAYFTASKTAHNVITSGGVDIELKEWVDEDKTVPFPEDGIKNVMPAAEVTKIVEVTNTGASAAWVRVKVDKTIELAEGVEGTPDPELIMLDINTTDWIKQGDFYYYSKALQPGKTTEPLFTTVTFAPKMGNEYQGSTAEIKVTADAVQVANNGDTVLDAKGWPESN